MKMSAIDQWKTVLMVLTFEGAETFEGTEDQNRGSNHSIIDLFIMSFFNLLYQGIKAVERPESMVQCMFFINHVNLSCLKSS